MGCSRIYYVGLRLSADTDLLLREHLKHNAASQDLHVTLAYSRRWFPYEQRAWRVIVDPKTYKTEVFGAVKVLAFDSPEVTDRFAQFFNDGATWDYPEYRPHVTVGGAGDWFLRPTFPIILEQEYYMTWKRT